MIASMRACVCGALGLFVAACSDPQNRAHVPDQPQSPDGTAVIVLGHPAPRPEPVMVAADEPEPTFVQKQAPIGLATSEADLAAQVQDSRKSRWSPRAMPLVVAELQTLERLLASTPSNAPDKPRIIRRLGEEYVELEYTALREKQRLSSTSGSSGTEQNAKFDKVIKAAQTMSIKHYRELLDRHPNFCQSPHPSDPAKSQGCNDEVLYFLGLEMQHVDQLPNARKYYFQLIKDFPQSKWIAHAYLAFGELFYSEAIGDPTKWEYARLSYEEVLKYPPPQNDTYGFARYRLAQVHHHKRDEPAALAHFVQAIDFANKYAGLPSSKPLGEIARREIVPSYAAAGIPRKAEAFFTRLTNDPSGTNEQVTNMLDALVQIYLRDNKRVEAGEVCRAFSGGAGAIQACGSI